MKLITWNIQRGRGPDDDYGMEHVVAHLRNWTDFDVLCLQEVASGYTDLPGNNGANQFAQLTELLPDFHAATGVTSDRLGTGSRRRQFGTMIFSRYPILASACHLLPWPADPAVMSMQRGALETTLETPQGLLRVTSTHLEYFSLLQRRAQVERLRELHAQACSHAAHIEPGNWSNGPFCAQPSTRNALLVGDFNFLADSSEHARLQGQFSDGAPPYRDAWELRFPGDPHAPTVGLQDDAGTPSTFDFVFVSDSLSKRVVQVEVGDHIVGPDHQPVLVELS